MAVLRDTLIVGSVGSGEILPAKVPHPNDPTKMVDAVAKKFMSDFFGYGWSIYPEYDAENKATGKYCLEIDDIVVRGSMSVFELIVQKIRAVNGAICVTQANGKIKTAELKNGMWHITLEDDENPFVADDFMLCQRFNREVSQIYRYHVEITDVMDDGTILVSEEEFGDSAWCSIDHPSVGDEVVQVGNSTNTKRQGIVYIHANETAAKPAIDVMMGVDTKDAFSKGTAIAVRLGGSLPDSPEAANGLWVKNGTIISQNSTTSVNNGIAYRFNPDGSGELAYGAIKWEKNGAFSINISSPQGVTEEYVENAIRDAAEEIDRELTNYNTRITATEKGLASKVSAEYVDTKTGEVEGRVESLIDQKADSISATVTSNVEGNLKSAGMEITADGIEVDADKFNLGKKKEDGTFQHYIEIGMEEGSGYPYFKFIDPKTNKEAYNLGFTGLAELIANTTKASFDDGEYYYKISDTPYVLGSNNTARPNDIMNAAFTNSGWSRFYCFTAQSTINQSTKEKIYAPIGGKDCDGKFYEDNSIIQYLPDADSIAPNGVYATRPMISGTQFLNFYSIDDGKRSMLSSYIIYGGKATCAYLVNGLHPEYNLSDQVPVFQSKDVDRNNSL